MNPLEIGRQFERVKLEMSILEGMVFEALAPPKVVFPAPEPPFQRPTYPPTALFYNGVKVEQPPTEAPEPRQAQHYDGRSWKPGPSPENAANPIDNPPGRG